MQIQEYLKVYYFSIIMYLFCFSLLILGKNNYSTSSCKGKLGKCSY